MNTNYLLNAMTNFEENEAMMKMGKMIVKNARNTSIGNKIIAEVPMELLKIDTSYQRECLSNKLRKNWDESKCSLLLTSYRDGWFYIMDGCHRYDAACANKKESLICEVFLNLTREDEAKIFSTQDDDKSRVKPEDKFKANVVWGEEVDTKINKLLRKYKYSVNKNERRSLRCLTEARNVVKVCGEEALDWIFNVSCKSGYDENKNAFTCGYLRSLKTVYSIHCDNLDVVTDRLVDLLSNVDPESITAYCNIRYMYISDKKTQMVRFYRDVADGIVSFDDIKDCNVVNSSNIISTLSDTSTVFLRKSKGETYKVCVKNGNNKAETFGVYSTKEEAEKIKSELIKKASNKVA